MHPPDGLKLLVRWVSCKPKPCVLSAVAKVMTSPRAWNALFDSMVHFTPLSYVGPINTPVAARQEESHS
jgi:hypothetical protein